MSPIPVVGGDTFRFERCVRCGRKLSTSALWAADGTWPVASEVGGGTKEFCGELAPLCRDCAHRGNTTARRRLTAGDLDAEARRVDPFDRPVQDDLFEGCGD